jgi:hypothetical protein
MFRSAWLFVSAIAWSAAAGASCGSAFCTINTSWDLQGGWAEPGARLDLRYEAINQNQPRKGGHDVSVGEVPRHHDEVYTRNRNWLGSFDYTFNSEWGVSVLAPFVDREHKHIHNHMGAELPETWNFNGVGDTRVIGRYRLGGHGNPDGTGTVGLNFGIKLPTGDFKKRNGDGELAERSLQPGSGTTDALLGGFASGDLPIPDWSWFAQGLAQLPMNARDGYKPGKRFAIDAGLRYDASDRWSLMLQLNGLKRSRDSGVEAEPEDSGGYSVWLGPGASYAVTRDIRAYGFLQLPVVQHVNGVQLVANKAWVFGVSARF